MPGKNFMRASLLLVVLARLGVVLLFTNMGTHRSTRARELQKMLAVCELEGPLAISL